MEEKVFLREGSLSVTWSRIIIGNQSYPISGITSIRTETTPPKRLGSFLLGIFGTVLLIAGLDNFGYLIVGLLLAALAVYLWRIAKPTYSIFFGTAGGEKQALSSTDGDYVSRVARAIDEALISRSQS